jgi:hypothetical protein
MQDTLIPSGNVNVKTSSESVTFWVSPPCSWFRGLGQELATPLASFAGSAAAGFFIGWTLRKILKILLLVVGLGLGVFFLAYSLWQTKDILERRR